MMLSIVIPTKNEENFLPILLRSIQQQTFLTKEVIVADAFSTDATRDIAKTFGCNVVDGGLPGQGRNLGALVAKGEMLLFLDADVELQDSRFLEKALQNLQKKQLDFATCDVEPLSSRWIDRFFYRCYNRYARLCSPIKAHAPGFCIFARKKFHDQMHGFDSHIIFCEDHEYVNRSRIYGRFGHLDPHIRIPVSIRRFDRDGRLKIALKYLLAEFHLWIFGPIYHQYFHYEFGHEKQQNNKKLFFL